MRGSRGVPGQLLARAAGARPRLLERVVVGEELAHGERERRDVTGGHDATGAEALIGSAIPPTSYAIAGTPAPSDWRSAPLWSSSGL